MPDAARGRRRGGSPSSSRAPRCSEWTSSTAIWSSHAYGILAGLGLADITVDYVVVDTVRVPRETFATILEAWRDGYVESVSEVTRLTPEQARAYFDQMIANIRDPRGYAVWMVPVVSGRIP